MKSTVHAKKLACGVVVGGVMYAAVMAPATAAAPVTVPPATSATPVVSPLSLLPGPLACLLSTGSAGFCVGIA
jgi:hypothetical protein